MLHQVVHINALFTPADKHLQLRLVEHAHPARLYQLKKATQERSSSAVHLPIEPEVS
jgi:hypothetical protein